MNRLQKLFNIKAGENVPVFILFTYFFLFGAMITAGKTARNTYFLNRFDTSYLPLMFMGVAGAVTLTVVIYTRLSKRMGLIPLISVSGIFFALTLILLQFRLEGGFIPVLYVTIDVIVTVMSTQFWILAGGVFNSRQAKRLFGIILSASPIASIIIGAGIPPFVSQFGSGYLLILTAVFILCCVLMAQLAKPYFSQGITAQRPAEPQSKGRSFLDGYMKTIAVATGSAAIVIVIVEYQFLIISSRSFPSESELAGFFGLFYAITGVISLLIQVFLTGWILTKFGILPGMLVLPTGLSIGSVAILFSPLLASALIARTSDQVTKFTINKTSVELLWLPVAPERKQGGKLFIDGTIKTGLEGVVEVV